MAKVYCKCSKEIITERMHTDGICDDCLSLTKPLVPNHLQENHCNLFKQKHKYRLEGIVRGLEFARGELYVVSNDFTGVNHSIIHSHTDKINTILESLEALEIDILKIEQE